MKNSYVLTYQIAAIHHIGYQVVINIRETCCSIFTVEESNWNVGWVGEVDHIDGRLACCSRMKKDPNIRRRTEIRVKWKHRPCL
jgi:hypothetical protein